MVNAVEDALSRASAEQRERAQQAIEEARRNIKLVSMQPGDMSSADASSISHNAQVIEEAKRTIPFETMRDVNEISAPLPTPNTKAINRSNVVQLHPNTQENIESIEQGEGNNYLRENAVDRALKRQSQEQQQWDQQKQQEALSR